MLDWMYNLPLDRNQQYVAHFIVGLVITSCFIKKVHLGLSMSFVAGLLKEFADYDSRGEFDVLDVLATIAAALIYLIIKIMKKYNLFLVLFIALVGFNSCGSTKGVNANGFQPITVERGNHRFTDSERSINKKRPIYVWYFKEWSRYLHYEGEEVLWKGDQKDWNKLIGHSYNLISNHRNSAMIGWRYNPIKDEFELNGYFHISGERVFTEPLIAIPIGVEFYTSIKETIRARNGNIQIEVYIEREDGKSVTHVQEFNKIYLPQTTRKIPTWFGGNLPAPTTITIYRKKLR